MTKTKFIPLTILIIYSAGLLQAQVQEHFKDVDQVIWVVANLDRTIKGWKALGFNQIRDPVEVRAALKSDNKSYSFIMAKANLGGANVTWIQSDEGDNLFADFHSEYGDGAMSLVHEMSGEEAISDEIMRLSDLNIELLDVVTIHTVEGKLVYYFMDTNEKGKFYLAYTYGDTDDALMKNLSAVNRHNMKINQYAFAISAYEPVSSYWSRIGLPEFQISHPELDNTHYYGKPTDHSLIQGWQRHGTVAYEWCIPVKLPIVYDDHIKSHGEGIHHLAYTVDDMDKVLEDYRSRGFVNSMGGTWGEEAKPGSGRYEYIELEKAGGVTMELLWSFR